MSSGEWGFATPPDDPGDQFAPAADYGWTKLDWRLLLIGPAAVLKEFLIPAVAGIIGVSASGGGFQIWFVPLALLGAIAFGSLPWLTTAYRLTGTQFELRKGLINRSRQTAPLDRIRSVDLESSLLHRALGITKVKIGTGVDETRIELGALTPEVAESLRADLLLRRTTGGTAPTVEAPTDSADELPAPPPAPQAQVLAALDWSWLKFAPFSLSRLVVVAAAIGVLSQVADDLPIFDAEHMSAAWQWVRDLALVVLVVGVVVGVLGTWLVISIGGYAVQWFGLRLIRDRDNLQLTHGLFTTKSTTVEEARVRGVELSQPFLLRLVRGAELSTLSTGVGTGGVTQILPPSPLEVDTRVGADVLGSATPLAVTLAEHGPRARRRCYIRAIWGPLMVVVGAGVGVWLLEWPLVLIAIPAVLCAALAVWAGHSSYGHLGHALTPEHLVSGDGVFNRRRIALERDGIIGWVVHQSIFQRRVGLATVITTTAAGAEHVTIRDVPLARAVGLARATTPDILADFLVDRAV